MKKLILLCTTIIMAFSFSFLQVQAHDYQPFLEYDQNNAIIRESRMVLPVDDNFTINGTAPTNFQQGAFIDTVGENEIYLNLQYYLSSFIYLANSPDAVVTIIFSFVIDYDAVLNCPECQIVVPRASTHYGDICYDGFPSSGQVLPYNWSRMNYNDGENSKLFRTFTANNLPNEIDFEVNFAYTPHSMGGYYDDYIAMTQQYHDPAQVKMNFVHIMVDYLTPIGGEVEDLGVNYTQAPTMNGSFGRVTDVESIEPLTRTYKITYINPQLKLYSFLVNIPEGIDVEATSFTPSYFRVFKDTSSSNDLFLVYVPNTNNPLIVNGDLSVYLTDKYTHIINVSQGTFISLGNTKIYGVVAYEPGSLAYAYFYLPVPIDTFESMTLLYDYRYKGYFTGWQEWNTKYDTYNNGTESVVPYWSWSLLYSVKLYNPLHTNTYDVVQSKHLADLPGAVQHQLVHTFDITLFDLASSNIYKVFLGKFEKAFTYQFEITSLVVISFQYVYTGNLIELDFSLEDSIIHYTSPIKGPVGTIVDWGTSVIDSVSEPIERLFSLSKGLVSGLMGITVFIGLVIVAKSYFQSSSASKKGYRRK